MKKNLASILMLLFLSVCKTQAQEANAGEDIYLSSPETSIMLNASALAEMTYGNWSLVCGTGTFTDVMSPQSWHVRTSKYLFQ